MKDEVPKHTHDNANNEAYSKHGCEINEQFLDVHSSTSSLERQSIVEDFLSRDKIQSRTWPCALSLARPSGHLNIPTASGRCRLPGESKIYNNREVHVDRLAVFQAGLILPLPHCRNGRFLEAQTLSRCL